MRKIYKRILPVAISLVMSTLFGTVSYGQFGCGSGVVIADGYTQLGITTPGTGGAEDWNINPTGTSISGSYWDDDVYLFEYTGGATPENISMTIFTRNSWNGIGIFENCNVDEFSIELDAASTTSSGVSQTVSADIAAGQTVYIAVGQWGSPNDLDFDVTDFTVTQLPLCTTPSGLTFSEIGADSVVVEWTENGSATDWVIEYGTAGFTIGSGTQINTTDNPDTITGLNAETNYDVYVWADCGGGDLSDTISGSFTTQPTCVSVTNITFSDIGPDSTVVSWTAGGSETVWNIEYGPEGFTPGSGTTITGVDNPDTLTGLSGATSYDVYVTADCGGGDVADPTGPANFVTEGTCGNYELQLDDSFGDGWNGGFVDVYINGTLEYPGLTLGSGSTVTYEIPMNINDIVSIEFTAGGFVTECSYELFDEQGTSLAIEGDNGGTPGNIGDPAIPTGFQACPTCPAPSDVTIDTVGVDFAEVSWTVNGTETAWNLEYDTTGFTLGNGNFVYNTTNNPYTINGLQSGATYDVYVQASCSGADSSLVTIPLSFTTAFSCGDTIYDNGGPTGDYANNSDDIYRMYAGAPNQYIRLAFEEFETESNFDGIYVYDGDDLNDSLLGSADPGAFGFVSDSGAWFGTDIPGPFYSSNAQGALTMNFGSDGSVQRPGFKGVVDCFDCDPTPGVDGNVDVCRLDDTLDLNSIVTLPTHADTSRMGQWMFPANPGVLVQDSLILVTTIAAGTYEAWYILNTPCGGDTTVATFTVYNPSQAGENGTLTVCLNEPINLFDGLNGNVDLGGTWYDPSNDPLPNSQPTASNIPGNYNFDYVTSNGVCPADTALVEVIVDGGCDWLSVGKEELNEISVYPNPASNVINVVNPTNMSALKVEIVDVNGRIVASDDKALENSTEGSIAIDHLETGIYTLRVYGENGQKTFKIVKK